MPLHSYTGMNHAEVTLAAPEIIGLPEARPIIAPAAGPNRILLVSDIIIHKRGEPAAGPGSSSQMAIAFTDQASGFMPTSGLSSVQSTLSNGVIVRSLPALFQSGERWLHTEPGMVYNNDWIDYPLHPDMPLRVCAVGSAGRWRTATANFADTDASITFIVRYEILQFDG